VSGEKSIIAHCPNSKLLRSHTVNKMIGFSTRQFKVCAIFNAQDLVETVLRMRDD